MSSPSVPLPLLPVLSEVPIKTKQNKKTPKTQEQDFGPSHPCLDGVFVPVTSLTTVQPWLAVVGSSSQGGAATWFILCSRGE